MLDRPHSDAGRTAETERSSRRWPWAFVCVAGVMGAAGVVVGAAGAHVGGGDVARTASEFLLVHAAVLVGAGAAALTLRRTSALLVAAMGLLAVGALLFGGELASASLLNWRPLPLAAPTGGLCLIAGWLLVGVAALAAMAGRG